MQHCLRRQNLSRKVHLVVVDMHSEIETNNCKKRLRLWQQVWKFGASPGQQRTIGHASDCDLPTSRLQVA